MHGRLQVEQSSIVLLMQHQLLKQTDGRTDEWGKEEGTNT